MNKPKFIFKVFLFLLALSAANIFAQTENKPPPAEACYEVVLQLLIASNSANEKNAVPPPLSNVVKKLKNLYSFSDYRLMTTFLQRTSNTIEYKSVLSGFNQVQNETAPVFSEWTLRNLESVQNAQGRNLLQIENFRFGARVPVTVGGLKDENGKMSPVINYESIGITTLKFTFSENEPTIIGSLATSKPDELMFLVLTVKPAE